MIQSPFSRNAEDVRDFSRTPSALWLNFAFFSPH
jgi:hypothetical protein